jgi:hypothetical protein
VVCTLANLDEFFGDNQSQNVDTLVEVTKKFFTFVSQLAEIVDDLEGRYAELNKKIDQISQRPAVTAPSPASTPSRVPSAPQTSSLPTAPVSTPESLPTPPGFPSPPAPAQPSVTASGPPQQPASTSPPSSLPPLPGQAPPAQQPGFAPPPGPTGQFGSPQAPPQPSRPSPMSLKAQMNMELKEAFARIRKGWDDEK